LKEGETTNDIFAFLTTEPNAEVGAIHPKAMILITSAEVDTWMTGSSDEALKLQPTASGWDAQNRCPASRGLANSVEARRG
jgi:putative SOS response-associated peptidase YedK